MPRLVLDKPESPRLVLDEPVGVADLLEPTSRLAEFGGELKHIPWHQYVPFTGSTVTALETFDLYKATRRLEDLDYPKGWEGELQQEIDEQRVARFFTEQERQSQLGFGGKVARGLSILPSWMGEFLLTGGLYSLGKKGAAQLGGKALTQWVAGSAVRTTLGAPQRTVEAVLKRRIMEEPEGWATSIAKGWGEVFIEMASEEAGAGITNILKKGIGKLPFGKKFVDGLFKAWKKITPKGTKAAFLNQIFTKAGYSNLIGEIGEERLATLMHALAKTDDFGAGKDAGRFQRLVAGIEQDYKNFPVELTVLSVPGAARFTLGKMVGMPEAITPVAPVAEKKVAGIKLFRSGEQVDLSNIGDRGLPLTTDKKVAEKFLENKRAGRRNLRMGGIITPEVQLEEFALSPDAKIATKKDIPKDLFDAYKETKPLLNPEKGEAMLGKWAKENGFDAIDYRTLGKESAKEAEIKVLNPDVIQPSPTPSAPVAEGKVEIVPIEQLPERGVGLPKKEWQAQVESIKKAGIKEPVIVDPDTGRVLDGIRRIAIAREIGLKEISVKYVKAENFAAPTPSALERPATREQKAQAHILARERGISEEDYRELAGKSMAEMTSTEAERFIGALRAPVERLDLTDRERKTIRGATSEEVLVRTIDYATRLGDVPKEKQLRRAYIQNLQLIARSQQKRALKLDLKEGKANLINQFSSARYAMGEAEIKSGLPLRQEHTNIVYKANQAKLQALNILTTALKEAGTTPFRVAMRKQQNDKIAEWLFEEDADKRKTKWEKLDEPTKAVANQLHEIFQGPAALEIREAQWVIWNEGGRQPSNAPDSALEEGRQAQREGRLKEWIASQTWGTREFYYMSSAQIGDLAESLSKMSMSLSIEEKPPRVGAKPKVYLPEVKARKYAKRAKGGSVINATLDHLERVMVANAVHEDLKTFWSDFAKAEPTRGDISVMKEFIDSALGKHKRAVLPVRAVRKVARAFWRFYFISPLKSGWFATRNLLQNIAWGPSELPISQWILSAKSILAEKITGKVNEERAAAFARDFKTKIDQKRPMLRQFLLQEEGNITRTAGNRAVILMDMAGQAAVLSDFANRAMCWPIMYDAAQRNLNLYLNGKISYNKLARKLKLDTFHLSQQLELQQLANKRGKRDFVAKYAEYKTENVHFRYETAFRSAAEQTPAGRVIMGLYVYPKGVAEIIYQNAVKPTIQGWQTGNYNKAYQGLTVLMMLFAGGAAAERLIREIAGRYAYDVLATVFSYNPFGPGAGLLFDFFNRIGRVVYWAEREKKSPAEIADAAAAAAVDQLEFFIPMCDGYINYYENKNNKAGVRLYRLMKKEALSKYFRIKRVKFRRSNRDFHEKIQHQLFGGAEWPEKE